MFHAGVSQPLELTLTFKAGAGGKTTFTDSEIATCEKYCYPIRDSLLFCSSHFCLSRVHAVKDLDDYHLSIGNESLGNASIRLKLA